MGAPEVRLYAEVLDAAIGRLGADAVSVQVVDDARPDRLRLIAWRGFHPASAAFWQFVRSGSATTCGAALAAGDRLVMPDLEEVEALVGSGDLHEYRRSGLRAVQSTPLRGRNGRVMGVLSTHWRSPHAPREEELRLIDQLAQKALRRRAASLNADLHRRLRDATQRSRGRSAVGAASSSARRARLLQAFIHRSRDGALLLHCAWCGRIELDGIWALPDAFLARGLPERLRERATHGICPDCLARELGAPTER